MPIWTALWNALPEVGLLCGVFALTAVVCWLVWDKGEDHGR
jgi:hypothetical protein